MSYKFPSNPNYVRNFAIEGYTDLNYCNGWDHSEETKPDSYKKCRIQKHKIRECDNSYSLNRGTDIISICDECKIFWHTDMSD